MAQLAFCAMYDSAEEATSAAIARGGKEFKQVAQMLFPALAPTSAYARLKSCLNPDKDEKLTANEHITIALYVGEFDFLHYCASACSHSQPSPISPADEHASLVRAFNERVDELRRMADRIQSVDKLRAVR